jgi:hypothetical protein
VKYSQSTRRKDQRNWYLIAAIILSLIWSFLVLWPKLSDYYRVPGDVRTFYWMAKYQDPALFPSDDFLACNDLVELNLWGKPLLLYPTSLGYGLLFYAASFLVEPIIFGKLLFILLVPLSVGTLYKFGKTITGSKEVAFILSILFVYFNVPSSTAMSVASGLQRAFALPLLVLFLHFLQIEKYRLASFLIPLSALIYIPTALLIAVTYLFSFVDLKKENGFYIQLDGEKIYPFFLAILLTLPIAAWVLIDWFELFDPSATSTLIREARSLNYLFVGFPWLGRTSFFTKLGDAFDFLVLLFLSALIYFVFREKSLTSYPSSCWSLLLAGMFLYALSLGTIHAFSSTIFYLPSRYSRLSLFLVLLIFVGINLKQFLAYVTEHFVGAIKMIIGVGVMVLVGFFVVDHFWGETASILYATGWIELFVFLSLGLSFFVLYRIWSAQSRQAFNLVFSIAMAGLALLLGVLHARVTGFLTLNPSEEQRALYAYVSQLPKGVLLSGSPDELSDITLFSHRDVLIKDLDPDSNMPIVEAMDAYYAEDPAEILEFCQRYGVDYLVRDMKDFETSFINQGRFFSIYNQTIQSEVMERTDFALIHVQPEFEYGALGVIECDDDLILE